MNKRQVNNITRGLKDLFEVYSNEDKRVIFWALLRDTISQDIEGVDWMYYKVREFVDADFKPVDSKQN